MTQADALHRALDELVDEASMESFPASDPPSHWSRDPLTVPTTLYPRDEDDG